MIDSHAHLQDNLIADYAKAIENANSAGVAKIICASSDLETSKKAVLIADQFDCVYAIVGIHPEEANSFNKNSIKNLTDLASSKKVVAIGEIGLDYFHEFASRDLQKEIFEKQIDLAQKLNLPIVIHSRESTGDLMDILRKNLPKLKSGVCIHCFNMSLEILKEITSYGFYISIGGIVTFKNGRNIIDIAKNCDINKLMLETDTPYLAPVPLRGKINEPQNVRLVAEKIAEIRGITLQELDDITTANTLRFFNIKE